MEQQSINISYTPGNREPDCQIPLLYEITRFGELQTVNCTVNLKTNIPGWLQLRKFHITYRMHQGRCLALYNELNDSKNIDCSLFIDKAYAEIMEQENLKIHKQALAF